MRTPLPEERLNSPIDSLRTPGGETSTGHGSSPSRSPDHFANNHSALSISNEPQAQDTRRPTCTCMAAVAKEDLVPLESDETLLSIYKNQLSSRFPFVTIPAGTTARQLQASRPLLMKVIRMVASVRHLRLMKGQSHAVMEHISNAILIRSERSLDLLQGILVFLGFYHYFCMTHAQFNNLTRLAVSLAEDMDLSTCPKSRQRRSQLPLVRAEESISRTNEERRALLGVWYMSSKWVSHRLNTASYKTKLT